VTILTTIVFLCKIISSIDLRVLFKGAGGLQKLSTGRRFRFLEPGVGISEAIAGGIRILRGLDEIADGIRLLHGPGIIAKSGVAKGIL